MVLIFCSINIKNDICISMFCFVRCAHFFNQLCVLSFADSWISSNIQTAFPFQWMWCQVGTSLASGGDLLLIFTLDLQLRFVLAVTGNLISIKMSTSFILISARCNFVNCIMRTAATKFYLSAN